MAEKSQRFRDRASQLRYTAGNDKDPVQKAKLTELAVQWRRWQTRPRSWKASSA